MTSLALLFLILLPCQEGPSERPLRENFGFVLGFFLANPSKCPLSLVSPALLVVLFSPEVLRSLESLQRKEYGSMDHLWFVDVFSRRNGSTGLLRDHLLFFRCFFANPKVKGWAGFWKKVVSYGKTRCCWRFRDV